MGKQCKIIGAVGMRLRNKDDFYPTPDYVTEALLKNQVFYGTIWECACGAGHMSEVLKKAGYHVVSTDLVRRGYYDQSPRNVDFLLEQTKMDNIVTNPPFNLSFEFMEQGIRLAEKCLALLLPVRYLTGIRRARFYKEHPPSKIIVIPNKVDFMGLGNPAMEFAWFVWEKGRTASEIVWSETRND